MMDGRRGKGDPTSRIQGRHVPRSAPGFRRKTVDGPTKCPQTVWVTVAGEAGWRCAVMQLWWCCSASVHRDVGPPRPLLQARFPLDGGVFPPFLTARPKSRVPCVPCQKQACISRDKRVGPFFFLSLEPRTGDRGAICLVKDIGPSFRRRRISRPPYKSLLERSARAYQVRPTIETRRNTRHQTPDRRRSHSPTNAFVLASTRTPANPTHRRSELANGY